VLSDGIADVTNEVGDDLRARFRQLLTSAEDALDKLDPATAWVEFEPDFRRRVASCVTEHHVAVHDRLAGCVQRVAGVFSDEEARVEDLIPDIVSIEPDDEAAIALKDVKKAGVGARAMGAVRASYSGAVLTGFVTGVLGLTLAAPIALAAGAAVGFRGIREDSRRQLAQRQAQAKGAMRQYVDEVTGALSKETRDTVRRTQRTLRDHFTERADQLSRSAIAALEAAKRAQALAEQDAAERLAAASTDIEYITTVRDLAAKTATAIAEATGKPER
jgi:hypothetical protein